MLLARQIHGDYKHPGLVKLLTIHPPLPHFNCAAARTDRCWWLRDLDWFKGKSPSEWLSQWSFLIRAVECSLVRNLLHWIKLFFNYFVANMNRTQHMPFPPVHLFVLRPLGLTFAFFSSPWGTNLTFLTVLLPWCRLNLVRIASLFCHHDPTRAVCVSNQGSVFQALFPDWTRRHIKGGRGGRLRWANDVISGGKERKEKEKKGQKRSSEIDSWPRHGNGCQLIVPLVVENSHFEALGPCQVFRTDGRQLHSCRRSKTNRVQCPYGIFIVCLRWDGQQDTLHMGKEKENGRRER